MRAKLLPDGVIDRVATYSPRLAAYLDWCDHGNMWRSGGPMNGQQVRRGIVRDIAHLMQPAAVVETGTFRGETTAFLADVTGVKTYSCELSRRHYEYAVRRFRRHRDIDVTNSDSRVFLRSLADRPEVPKTDVLFYLDAHWNEDLPLAGELELIDEHWSRGVILIDDFEVPNDSGYGFDDYGPDRRLTAAYLPAKVMEGRTALYPNVPSADETGARRGWVAIVDDDRVERMCASLALMPQ